ncbi:hypothetical protein AUR64_18225 [Haloprofundus marisrubri]|uniref:NAD(P)-binding domain-containing protein n=1 Tax=Haloprofundus marisrubri TaxID=1514971 RepID=A0A0W1R5B7_9EURY|nr:SDR family oxidoreductase [Haloprofundus marisrubri]KTG08606.1 hypothetical protein AUR64_18225 [Haloprofundus marisrubri]
MNLTVFGATGRTGRPLVERALDSGHHVTAFVRDVETFDLEHENLQVVEGDVTDAEAVSEGVDGADAVFSALGHTSSSGDDVLTVGGRNILAAMDEHGVDRFVTLAGAAVRTKSDPPSLGARAMGSVMGLVAGGLLSDARQHVLDVRDSDRRWTVVRPPRLTEGAYTGEYDVGYLKLGPRNSVSRADVAAFMLRCVENDEWVGEMPMVSG